MIPLDNRPYVRSACKIEDFFDQEMTTSSNG